MTWQIRLAERRDISELLAIEQIQFPEPWTRGMLLDEVTNTETRRYTVVVKDGKILGYLGVMFVMDELHINTIGVLPDFEGKGIGAALMDDAWRDAKERNIERATLEVAVSNKRAQDLYYRYGFKPVGIRKNYYDKIGEDALVLWADLPVEDKP